MTFEAALGGEFELYVKDLGGPPDLGGIPSYGRNSFLLCNTGRAALALALKDWMYRGGTGVVWLPDYLCQSIAAACERYGCQIKYFSDRPNRLNHNYSLAPEKNDAVLFVHYFGFRNDGFLNWLNKFPRERNWVLIEDCVQALFSGYVGSYGDYVITSFRKWGAVPDGASIHSDHMLERTEMLDPDEVFVSMKVAAKLMRGQRRPAKDFLSLINESEKRLDSDAPRHMSWMSRHLIGQYDTKSISKIRRDNWIRLNEALVCIPEIRERLIPLFPTLDELAVPLCFPVRVTEGKRDLLRLWLGDNEIYCPIHWAIDDVYGISTETLTLSQEVLSLPIDQRYKQNDIERLVSSISAFYRVK